MATVATLNIKIGADWAEAKRAFSEVQSAVKPFADGMTRVGKTLTRYVSLPLLAAGAASVKFAGDFEQAMTNTVSVTGLTGDAAVEAEKKMTALAMQLGRETAFTAYQAAEAMYDLASSGWDAEQMARGLPGILSLAAATQGDLAVTTEATTSTLGQFGLDAGESARVADVFTAAIGTSKANMDRLIPSLRMVGPIAASMGLTLEDTVAALAALYKAGFQGEQAGTALRAGLASLIGPAGAGKAALRELGLTLSDVNPQTHGLAAVMETLGQAGITSGQALALFGREAAAGMLALINNTGEIRRVEEVLDSAGGTAARVAKDQLDTFNGQMTILIGSLQTAAIALGTVFLPKLQAIAEALIPVINRFANLPGPVLETIATVGVLVAALGPLLFALGTTIGFIPHIVAGFKLIGAVSVAMAAKVALITAGVVALVAAGWWLASNWDEIGQFILRTLGKSVRFLHVVITALSALGQAPEGLATQLGKVAANLDRNIAAGATEGLKTFGQVADEAKAKLASLVSTVTGEGVPGFSGGGGDGGGGGTPTRTFGAEGLSGMAGLGPEVLGGMMQVPTQLRGFSDSVVNEMGRLNQRMIEKRNEFSRLVAELVNILKDGMTNALIGLAEGFGAMAAGTKSLGDVGKDLLSTFANVLVQLGGALIAFGVAGEAWNATGGFLGFLDPLSAGAKIAIGAALIAAGSAIKGVLSSASKGGGGGRGASYSFGSVNPNLASTSNGGVGGDQTMNHMVTVVPQALPSGDLVFAQAEGTRRMDRYGTKMR